jgi:ABC-type multidrug transport system fused ATPase/permease subunit
MIYPVTCDRDFSEDIASPSPRWCSSSRLQVADEVLTSLRTVTSMNAEAKEAVRYISLLVEAQELGIKNALFGACAIGMTIGVMFCTYGLALWFGGTLIANQTMNATTGKPFTGGDVVTVFFSVLMGAFALGQSTPGITAAVAAKGAAARMFAVIERVPPIDSAAETGEKLPALRGDIVFEDVEFNYPTRPDSQVLNKLNLRIPAGATVALVGHSGCGKSTVISLLERWYDPKAGRITVDGVDIRTLNLKWWRSAIGLVQQEPILFNVSLAENIRLGKSDATDEQIRAAASAANALQFIEALPHQFNQMIGESGVEQLSGGQKQRVAIARAIVKEPVCLLLDEATSALDNESERVVQEALDKLMPGKTAIVIAHRLSTIRHADIIMVMDAGQVVEQGKHDELMTLNGIYAKLVMAQMKGPLGEQLPSHVLTANPLSRDTDTAPAALAAAAPTVVINVDRATTGEAEMKGNTESTSVDVRSHSDKVKDQAELEKARIDAMIQKAAEEAPEVPLSRVLSLSKDDWGWIAVGMVGSACSGTIFPAFSQIFSNMMASFYKKVPEMQEDTANLAYAFVGIGVIMFTVNVMQRYGFAVVGERLTETMRQLSFKAFLRQNMGWYVWEFLTPRARLADFVFINLFLLLLFPLHSLLVLSPVFFSSRHVQVRRRAQPTASAGVQIGNRSCRCAWLCVRKHWHHHANFHHVDCRDRHGVCVRLAIGICHLGHRTIGGAVGCIANEVHCRRPGRVQSGVGKEWASGHRILGGHSDCECVHVRGQCLATIQRPTGSSICFGCPPGACVWHWVWIVPADHDVVQRPVLLVWRLVDQQWLHGVSQCAQSVLCHHHGTNDIHHPSVQCFLLLLLLLRT